MKTSQPFVELLVHQITEGLPKLHKDLIDRVIPLHEVAGVEFEEIRIEIWADSGRMIAFPALKKFKDRTEITGFQIISSELLERSNELTDSDLSDEEFEIVYEELISDLVESIIDKLVPLPNFDFAIYDSEGDSLGRISPIKSA